MVKATPKSEAGVMPGPELFEAMGKYNEELVNAGIMKAGEGLQPSSRGARVHFSGAKRTVIDGPFTETKELVAGFWIWECKSLAEDSDIESRPIYEAEDLGEAFTPEERAREERLRARIEKKK